MFVVVADSQSVFKQMLAQIMEQQQVGFQLCNTGAEVVEIMSQRHVDLFVLTMNLPDIKGADLCRKIRDTIKDDCIPIIILTAEERGNSFAKAFDEGATDIFRRSNIESFSDYLQNLSANNALLAGRALIVEDSRSQRLQLKACLQEWGLEVDDFESVKPALAAHKDHPYDVILTDIELNRLENGLDFVHDIRGLPPGLGDVAIIATTAYLSDSTRVNFLARGINRCMLKPLLMPELRSELKKQLDSRQASLGLIEAKSQEADKNQAKSVFIARMSHELRTSLNAIIGFSNLMLQESFSLDEARECAKNINDSGKLLLELINEVLDLSQIESGNVALSIEAVNLGVLLDRCQQVMTSFAEENQVQLKIENSLPDVNVLCDKVRLLEVLFNLISNAVKYNKAEGLVKVYPEHCDDGYLRIHVVDTGIGISSDKLEAIFEPFSRVHDQRLAVQGTGIGLPIAQNLVRLINGRLGVDSTLGKGSHFWVDIPTTVEQVADAAEHFSQLGSKVLKPCELIYVDDNPVNCLLVERWCSKRTGVSIRIATSAEQGLQLIAQQCPDVLITDINMPEHDGFWLLNQLRKDSRWNSLPVIALTAMAMNEEVSRGRLSDFQAYVTKPVDFSLLAKEINRLLDTP